MNEHIPSGNDGEMLPPDQQSYDVLAGPGWAEFLDEVAEIESGLTTYVGGDLNPDVEEDVLDRLKKILNYTLCRSDIAGRAYKNALSAPKADNEGYVVCEQAHYQCGDLLYLSDKWRVALKFIDTNDDADEGKTTYHLLPDALNLHKFITSPWNEADNEALDSSDAFDLIHFQYKPLCEVAEGEPRTVLSQRGLREIAERSTDEIKELIELPYVRITCKKYYVGYENMPGFELSEPIDHTDREDDELIYIEGRLLKFCYPELDDLPAGTPITPDMFLNDGAPLLVMVDDAREQTYYIFPQTVATITDEQIG